VRNFVAGLGEERWGNQSVGEHRKGSAKRLESREQRVESREQRVETRNKRISVSDARGTSMHHPSELLRYTARSGSGIVARERTQ
jgi:hypothetical protein